MAKPKKKTSTKKPSKKPAKTVAAEPKFKGVTFRIPKDVKRLIERAAKTDGRSLTSWVVKNWRDQLETKADKLERPFEEAPLKGSPMEPEDDDGVELEAIDEPDLVALTAAEASAAQARLAEDDGEAEPETETIHEPEPEPTPMFPITKARVA